MLYAGRTRARRGVLERYGLATKHRLGQNFLVNDDVIGKILALAELGADDVVFEVGPGIGTLTVAMLPLAAAPSVPWRPTVSSSPCWPRPARATRSALRS